MENWIQKESFDFGLTNSLKTSGSKIQKSDKIKYFYRILSSRIDYRFRVEI